MDNADSILSRVEQVIEKGPFQATWESLRNYEIPQWYEDDKFGVFIHWGAYAVPAFGSEWYPRNMYRKEAPEFEHHRKTYGPHDQFGYKDFIPQFRAENFDPADWADLFKKSGARFIVPVAEHHDGFPMYRSELTEWCAGKMGPKRDLINELANAVKERGMTFGASSHRAEHWWFFDAGMTFDSDVRDSKYAGLYGPAEPEGTQPNEAFLNDWLARTCEIVDRFRPQIVWFDWWIEQPSFEPYLRKFAAYYYNRGAEWGKGVAINYKYKSFPVGTAVFDIERGQLAEIREYFWQTDTSISKNSWGYVSQQDYKSADSIIDDLIDIVSKNGALLLNIGPKADGTIPEKEREILLEIGAWLDRNGEAIYGTRPWKVYGEGPTEVSDGAFTDTKRTTFTGEDIRFAARGGDLYAIALAWPGEEMRVKSLGTASGYCDGRIADVSLLGHAGKLEWTQEAAALKVRLPEIKPGDYAYAIKVAWER
jgi:alpha-L-fucosidase